MLIPAVPIPSNPSPSAPAYIGHAAQPRPIRGIAPPPQNPFMAANGRSEIHDDAWQTNVYWQGGPLGRSPGTSSSLLTRDCGSIAFDRRGRIVSICIGLDGPRLFMFNPATLATIATFDLPPRVGTPGNVFQDFTGGGYFYLDNNDRVVTSTTTRHIYVIADRGVGFGLVRDYDLTSALAPQEKITSALPDSHGLLWVVTRTDGVVATLDLATGKLHAIKLGHGADGEIENSFATDQQGGVYVATNRKLYRFDAGQPNDVPKIAWQVRYPNSYEHKPGQVDDGTGTTPSVMPGGYVNITDNADPMDVVAYRTASKLHGQRRMVCRVPVFRRGASDTENSLISAGRSMIVENNYGYSGPGAVTGGKTTTPGLARVDLNRGGRGCRLVWTNRTVAAPTVVPKLSLSNGLIYTYTKPSGISDPWYWTALDFRTGRVVFKRFAGTGTLYNNNYAGIALGPNGRAYLGTIGGIISMWG